MSDFASTRRRISAACASIRAERQSPPSGAGATEPASRTRAAHRTALAAFTPKRTAAARQDDPAAIAATTRSRKSTDSALDIPFAPHAEGQLNHHRAARGVTSDSVRQENALSVGTEPLQAVWSHMKRTGMARTPLRKGEQLRDKIDAQLAVIKAAPKLVQSFVLPPSVAYVLGW